VVVNVMSRCHSQLMRVFNTDILVHKVHTVLEKSIDPIARSLALRALASMAELLVNNLRVHSDVRNALRSPNEVEQTACILCVQRLSERSVAFASGAVGLIGALITALETPLSQRLQLIAVLQHMHRDPGTVLQSREILQDVMRRHPVAPIATACVGTLARLAVRSRMRIDEQMQLLLHTIHDECRGQVRLEGARSLARVLRFAPSCGSEQLALRLLQLARQESLRHDARCANATLGTVISLARVHALSAAPPEMVQGFRDLCGPPHPPHSRKLAAAAFALALYTHVLSGAVATPPPHATGAAAGGGGGAGVVHALVVEVVEAASELMSETEALAQCDFHLLDALLPLLALLLQAGQGGGGSEGGGLVTVLAAGRKLVQGCRVALVRTWLAKILISLCRTVPTTDSRCKADF